MKKFRAACVQIAANDVSGYLDGECKILEGIDEAHSKGADLAIFPECSYPSYYIGNDSESFAKAMEHLPVVFSSISRKTEKYGIYVACGFLLHEDGTLFNAGVLWGPDGMEIGRVRKSNMWHFDSQYVGYGRNYEVWDTELGRIGMMICADGRVPEITRIMALKGAEIVLDMANLVTSGKDPASLSNPQVEYMLPSRARENGIWLAMADKVGLEAGTVLNAGSSCIIDPFGRITAKASSDKEELLIGDIRPEVGKPSIPTRKPELYTPLTFSTEELPITKMISETLTPESSGCFASTVYFVYSSAAEYLEKACFFVKILEDQDSDFIVLPPMKNITLLEGVQAKLEDILDSDRTILALSCYSEGGENHMATIFSAEGTIGRFYKTHGCMYERGSHVLAPLETTLGNVSVMFDQEGLIPEVARTFMLQGAEILLWFDCINENTCHEDFCRTRSSENRIYLLYDGFENCNVTNPSGLIKAASLIGNDQAVSTIIFRPEARNKMVVPGTDVVWGRRPELYEILCRK